jgi:hypothetical protein
MTRYHDQTDRIFVRGVQGAYNLQQELERLRSQPRVRKAKDLKMVDGPQAYSRHYVEPKDGITQTFHLHLEEYSPGGKSQKHGHVNEAAFYILDGRGTRSTTISVTTGAQVMSRSSTTTASTSTSMRAKPSQQGLW